MAQGDYRLDYRAVCMTCSTQEAEPFYNELRTWRVPADGPCAEIREALVVAAALGCVSSRPTTTEGQAR